MKRVMAAVAVVAALACGMTGTARASWYDIDQFISQVSSDCSECSQSYQNVSNVSQGN